MTELNDFQLERLAEDIVQHMYQDEKLMYNVAYEHATGLSLDDYYEWFQEEPGDEDD